MHTQHHHTLQCKCTHNITIPCSANAHTTSLYPAVQMHTQHHHTLQCKCTHNITIPCSANAHTTSLYPAVQMHTQHHHTLQCKCTHNITIPCSANAHTTSPYPAVQALTICNLDMPKIASFHQPSCILIIGGHSPLLPDRIFPLWKESPDIGIYRVPLPTLFFNNAHAPTKTILLEILRGEVPKYAPVSSSSLFLVFDKSYGHAHTHTHAHAHAHAHIHTHTHTPPSSPNWMIDLMLVRGMNSKCLNCFAVEFLRPNPEAKRRLATCRGEHSFL